MNADPMIPTSLLRELLNDIKKQADEVAALVQAVQSARDNLDAAAEDLQDLIEQHESD